MRSGWIALERDNTLRGLGASGQKWSGYGTSYASSTRALAYDLGFSTTSINITENNNRYYAFPLRCLSTVLGM